MKRVWQRCNRFVDDEVAMLTDGRHQNMSKSKKEEHYAAVKEGKFDCYACDEQVRPGWGACFDCKVPLTESTVEQMILVADTYEEFLRLENLLTGESVASRSVKSQRNVNRAEFERTYQNKLDENVKAVGEYRIVHNGQI